MVVVPSGLQQSHVNGKNGPSSTWEQTEPTPKKMNTIMIGCTSLAGNLERTLLLDVEAEVESTLSHELNLIPSFLLRFAMAKLRESSQGSTKDTESMEPLSLGPAGSRVS